MRSHFICCFIHSDVLNLTFSFPLYIEYMNRVPIVGRLCYKMIIILSTKVLQQMQSTHRFLMLDGYVRAVVDE